MVKPGKQGAMQRPWLILITGPPCSGKSTLAVRLGQQCGLPVVAKDAFKEILFDVLGTGNAAWSRQLSQAAFSIQLGVADSLLAAGVSLLLEGNFNAAEHAARIRSLVTGRARALQLACNADETILAARRRLRSGEARRHPGHLDSQSEVAVADPSRYAPLPGLPSLAYDSGAAGEAGYAALLERLSSEGLPLGGALVPGT
jgi:predicted kinase